MLENGNTTMLIWLGKQYLGQREPKLEITQDEDAPPLKISFEIKEAVGEVTTTNAKS